LISRLRASTSASSRAPGSAVSASTQRRDPAEVDYYWDDLLSGGGQAHAGA
jgi:hypothetical protein